MFTNEIANIMLAGLCNGLLVSLPIGAVSMQAAYRWVNSQREDALVMASGVFLGDIVVAVVVMVLLRHNVVSVSWPFMLSGALLMFVIAGLINKYLKIIETTDSMALCFVMGFVLTIVQPGNYGTYLLNYGWGVQYFFSVPEMVDMTWGGITLLISMNCAGLIIGWWGYLWAVQRWGMGMQATFSFWTPRLVALAGIIALGHIAYDRFIAPALAG